MTTIASNSTTTLTNRYLASCYPHYSRVELRIHDKNELTIQIICSLHFKQLAWYLPFANLEVFGVFNTQRSEVVRANMVL